MNFFILDEHRQRLGPYSFEDLCRLQRHGVVRPETLVFDGGDPLPISFRDLWLQQRSRAVADNPFGETAPPGPDPAQEPGFAEQTTEDLRLLTPHLLIPLREMRTFRWHDNRRLLWITAVGLIPLFVVAFFGRDMKHAYWGVAFYFSALWAMFFYHLFATPEVRVSTAALCFFATGVISISILSLTYLIPPLSSIVNLVDSENLLNRAFGFIAGVGIPEETCKALVLFFILRQPGSFSPRSMLFYGLISGLGFGIYEGVSYQTGRNVWYSRGVGEYYLLNVIRLTTLPFLHAVWTGIAGYFIGFSAQFPERRRGLMVVAIGLPALLHGLYNTFAESLLGLVFALLSVLALNLYLAKTVDFARALAGRK